MMLYACMYCVTTGKNLIKEKIRPGGTTTLPQFFLAEFTYSDFVNFGNMSLCILKVIYRDNTIRLQKDTALSKISLAQTLKPSFLAMDFVIFCLS